MKKLILILALLLPIVTYSALSAVIIWEVRTTGNDTNGGGFKFGAAGTDMSLFGNKNLGSCTDCQSATVNISTTDAATTTTTTLTSATANFSAAIVGNVIYLAIGGGSCNSGTVTAGWREVTAYTNATTITLDATPAGSGDTCTGVTMNIGGALLSPAIAAANKVAGNDVFIKAGTYSITSASTNVAGGAVLDGGGTSTNTSIWAGYSTNRVVNNTDTKPLLQASGAIDTFVLLQMNATYATVSNISVDCASKAATTGIYFLGSYTRGVRIKAANCTSYGLRLGQSSGYGWCFLCEATGNSGTAGIYLMTATQCIGCESYANTTHGFQLGATAGCVGCLSYGNTGASSDGFNSSSIGYRCVGCTAYGNERRGFDLNGSQGVILVNSVAEASGVGFYAASSMTGAYLVNCAGYNNAGGDYNASYVTNVLNFQAVTAGSPFTSAPTGDFSLNSTASRGALLRAAGFPGIFPAGTTTGYVDIGVAQHADPAASGGTKAATWVQ